MAFRHLPFGVPEAALKRELKQRRREQLRKLAPRRRELARLRRAQAELSQYLTMLGAEIVVLADEERMLLRELAELSGKEWIPPGPAQLRADDAMEAQQRTLRHYRSLQTQLSASVLALIAPFLTDPAARSTGVERKEDATWPTPSGSGYAGR